MKAGSDATADLKKAGGVPGRKLSSMNGLVAEVPNRLLRWLESHPGVASVHHDRDVAAENLRTSVTVGALTARWEYGYWGQGIGVAVLDSGITSWSNDLIGSGAYGDQRVAAFVDFVNGQPLPYDDNGHGTHVAGTIAGNGFNSLGLKAGIAPAASLVVLKVLDGNGRGTISNIIAALDWMVANKAAYNIRVANLSIGAGVYESYWTDPLTLAAKRAADAGIVVVASAGNLGKNRLGHTQYGGITAPANAPWVLTVGASSTMGTFGRTDDTIAGYSSRGPSYLDYAAKPDIVAPGTGTVSLSDPNSLFYTTKSQFLVDGYISDLTYRPYLSLSGTSMSSPVVAGSVALMLEANPALTPNAVKAILQYTAQIYPQYDFLTQGAGFLNTAGAVKLAAFLKAPEGQPYPSKSVWAKHIIWGNHRVRGGLILPSGNAWSTAVVWGAARNARGGRITWGTDENCGPDGTCGTEDDNIVWGNEIIDCGPNGTCGDDDDNIVWGNDVIDCGPNGTCGDDDDNIVWGNAGGQGDNIVWGNDVIDCGPNGTCGDDDDNIVWGNAGDQGDNIVWGNDCAGADCTNQFWANTNDDALVWGNAPGENNIVWRLEIDCGPNGTCGDDDDNIVWGNDDPCGPNGICGDDDDNIVWGNAIDDVMFLDDSYGEGLPTTFDELFLPPSEVIVSPPPPDGTTTTTTATVTDTTSTTTSTVTGTTTTTMTTVGSLTGGTF